MQISASYELRFTDPETTEKACVIIEKILEEKNLDNWFPIVDKEDNKLFTYGEPIDWNDYEGFLVVLAQNIAYNFPNKHFTGESCFDNLSTGDNYGEKIEYHDNILETKSGVNLMRGGDGLAFCPYCGEEYDIEAIQSDIDTGDFETDENGCFSCFQCEMEISLDELTSESDACISSTYELIDGEFILK
ncbi:MAG: hypothetical protein J6Q94_02240 [Clostridia bacterium]|nr:hypothetical protein [Clostridia bacterium]